MGLSTLPSDPATSQPEPPELSLADHEQQFSRPSSPSADSSDATPPTSPDDHPASPEPPEVVVEGSPADRPRDEHGRFDKKEKSDRNKAKSQLATRADVPRIDQLTLRLRQAERERDVLQSQLASVGKTTPAVQVPVAPSAAPVEAEPTPEDLNPDGTPKYQTYEAYLKAIRAYDKNQLMNEWREQQRRELAASVQQAREEAEQRRIVSGFQSRLSASRARHEDFDDIAFNRPTAIPQGSLIDHWILEHASGAELLYYLQNDEAELNRLLAMPLMDQVDALSLLGQRLTPSSDQGNANPTGAVAVRSVITVPRPPTPVRTGPVRVPDEPPGEDASLAAHERFYGRPRHRPR